MNVLYANDTSDYHCGCSLTCNILTSLIKKYGTITKTLKCPSFQYNTPDWDTVNLSEIDIIIINGEGTVHHNSRGVQYIIKLAEKAKREGKKVCLINTVIDSVNCDMSIFDYISCRESISAQGKYNVVHDACFYHQVNYSPGKNILFSDSVNGGVSNQMKQLFGKHTDSLYVPFDGHHSYDEMLKSYQSARIVVTGRYHGVVFAMMSGKPFLAIRSNTHKIEGLCKDYKLERNMVNPNEIEERLNTNDYLIPDIDTNKIKDDIKKMVEDCFNV